MLEGMVHCGRSLAGIGGYGSFALRIWAERSLYEITEVREIGSPDKIQDYWHIDEIQAFAER
jgi:hypothetical protein